MIGMIITIYIWSATFYTSYKTNSLSLALIDNDDKLRFLPYNIIYDICKDRTTLGLIFIIPFLIAGIIGFLLPQFVYMITYFIINFNRITKK